MSGENSRIPPILFFFQESVEEAQDFFDRFWPEARGVSDSERRFYSAFGLTRGSLGQLIGPKVWLAGFRTLFGGGSVGVPSSDTRQLSGTFLVEGDTIVWAHRYSHSADHPDYDALLQRIRERGH